MRVKQEAGMHKGTQALLWGELQSSVGGTRPPRLSPEGNGKGDQNVLAAAG